VAFSLTDDFPVTDDFLELDSVDLSEPEDFDEAFREGWEPRLSEGVSELRPSAAARLSVGVAELRPSAAAASAFKAELR